MIEYLKKLDFSDCKDEQQLEWLRNHQIHYSKFACMQ